ncbi:MAG: hypothetical protein CM15mP58_19630 [Burkholderiaceae bacterium]|nr:MAG: hypothetical protein CM15mP58_19630 [Burkholderiaceae bacterium]
MEHDLIFLKSLKKFGSFFFYFLLCRYALILSFLVVSNGFPPETIGGYLGVSIKILEPYPFCTCLRYKWHGAATFTDG